MTKLAFLGLGAIGSPMAQGIARSGFSLSVFDPLADRTRSLVEIGARAAVSPADAAEGADAAILMVADANQAEEALFGRHGATQALGPEATVILMSTIGVGAATKLADKLAGEGLQALDAPVSGGVVRARTGDLLIMVGGSRVLFDRFRPVLEAVGSKIVHCGESAGQGQAVKLVNQLLCSVHLAAAGEALAYAEALELDPSFVFETIRHGAANSFMLDDRGGRMLTDEEVPVGSALDIFVKDTSLVLQAAEERDFHAPLISAAHRIYVEGASLGLGRKDDSRVVHVLKPSRKT